MSYAAMEGFLEAPPEPTSSADTWHQALEARLVERWVGTVFLMCLTGILALGLIYG